LSTDLGVFSPLTVSAQLRLEPDELIEDEEPKGGSDALLDTIVLVE
jgi:hypothetical protein